MFLFPSLSIPLHCQFVSVLLKGKDWLPEPVGLPTLHEWRTWACVGVCVCVGMHVCTCVHVCVCLCVCARALSWLGQPEDRSPHSSETGAPESRPAERRTACGNGSVPPESAVDRLAVLTWHASLCGCYARCLWRRPVTAWWWVPGGAQRSPTSASPAYVGRHSLAPRPGARHSGSRLCYPER